MNRFRTGVAAAWVLAGLLAGGTAVQAADKIQGTFALDAHSETLGHGFAWVDAKGQISVGFYTGALTDPKDQARAMKGEGAIYGLFDKPHAEITVRLASGATKADRPSFESCSIVFMGFEFGPYTWNASGDGCGPVELSGGIKAGGVIHGKFKGRAEAYPRSDGHKPVYTWDMDFTATLHAKP